MTNVPRIVTDIWTKLKRHPKMALQFGTSYASIALHLPSGQASATSPFMATNFLCKRIVSISPTVPPGLSTSNLQDST
eukprot:CAMPEP_0115721702 /NCGR_PEP_ID=MMETSP0272-20121206/79240_1 /TAXON_ID=71861 /ORGANISM="Scrippsiella trochoidea, Strain CCMP3099" /LENGTH=77 /DNA_ID=CAMNT_0003164585 /DNA_START=56 /DNA_END=285 /DNA_ORIENTATION=-